MRGFFYIIYKECVLISIFFSLMMIGGCREVKSANANEILLNTSHSLAGDYLAAQFAMRNGSIDSALKYYRAVLSKDPENSLLLEKTYKLMLINGDIEKALHLAKRKARLEQNNHENKEYLLIKLLLALEAMKKKNFLEVQEILSDNFIQNNMKKNEIISAIIPMLHVFSFVSQKKYEEALEQISLYKKGNNDLPFFLYRKALIYDLAGNEFYYKAEEIFNQLAATQQSYNVTNVIASFYNRNGKPKKAEATLKAFSKHNPQFGDITGKQLYEFNERSPENISLISMAEVFIEIANTLYKQGKKDSAAIYLRIALYLDENSEVAKIQLANIMEAKKQFAMAIKLYQEIPQNSYFHQLAQISIATNHYNEGNFDKTKKRLLKIQQNYPDAYEATLILGEMLIEKQEYQAAVNIYGIALERIGELQKRHWTIFYARGICFERLEKWDEAEADFKKALELHPNQPDVLNYLAYSWLLADKNLEEAEILLEKAVTNRPNDPHIIDSYGWALFKIGRYNEAAIVLEKANILAPYEPTTNDHLGDVYWQLGRYTESRYQWKRALAFNPEPGESAKIKLKIENGLPLKVEPIIKNNMLDNQI